MSRSLSGHAPVGPRLGTVVLSRAPVLGAAAAAAVLAASAWAALDPTRAGLSLLLAAVALLAAGAAWLDAGQGSAKEVTLVAALGGVAAASRVLFAFVPGVQPVTVIVLATGAALGPRAGMGVGAVAALVSNFFLGQGIWTPWQMLGWAACGAAGGALRHAVVRRYAFAAVAFALGVVFSGLMDVWEWFSFYPHTLGAFTVQLSRGLPFVLAHAIGNVVFALAIGPELRRLLDRHGRRLRTEVVWR